MKVLNFDCFAREIVMNSNFLLELGKLFLKNGLLFFSDHFAFLGFIDFRRHAGEWVVTGFFDLLFLDFF